MLSLSLPGRVFLCLLPTDMRKSFDSLAGLIEQQLGQITQQLKHLVVKPGRMAEFKHRAILGRQ